MFASKLQSRLRYKHKTYPETLYLADVMIMEVLHTAKAEGRYPVLVLLMPIFDHWNALDTHPSFALYLVGNDTTEAWEEAYEVLGGAGQPLAEKFGAAIALAKVVEGTSPEADTELGDGDD